MTLAALLFSVALWAAACSVALGPGYEIQKQDLRVRFEASGEPVVRVEAEYLLRNTGNRPLASLEVAMPGGRFRVSDLAALWDGQAVPLEESESRPGSTLLSFPVPWALRTRHTLRIDFVIREPAAGEPGLRFAPDAFFLPAERWSPELLAPQGLFNSGGVPPKKWNLLVTVPQDFLLHASGASPKRSRKGSETTYRCEQGARDLYPFLVAGRYQETLLSGGEQKVYLWTHGKAEIQGIQAASASLMRALDAYDANFGPRNSKRAPLWIAECPAAEGCFAGHGAPYAKLLGEPPDTSLAEMISPDTALVSPDSMASRLVAAAASAFAATWLGYGHNPDFYDQQPPMSALPAFAETLGREAMEGPAVREEMVREALKDIPREARRDAPEDPQAVHAKSLLFFYALRDFCGIADFRKSIQHMLSARRGSGFDVNDLIAAFEQDQHHNVAEFVRLWMKHPGVPQEFRERYESKAAPAATPVKENAP